MTIHRIQGTHDIPPEEVQRWARLKRCAADVVEKYGYDPIETPIIERIELFKRTIGANTDIVNKEMFNIQPHSEDADPITLRPEGTAPICRAYLQSRLLEKAKPLRLYYLGAMFRYERPQQGRYRQFQQFGIEVIGDDTPAMDAEVILIAHDFLRAVNADIKLRIALNSLGDKQDRLAYLEALRQHYSKHESDLSAQSRERLARSPLRMLDVLPSQSQVNADAESKLLFELSETAPCSLDYVNAAAKRHFEDLCELLTDVGIDYQTDHKMVRGLDYYTRTVFEIGADDFQSSRQATLIGGGRYDGLIELLGGAPTPAVGFAAGLNRILEISAPDIASAPPLAVIIHTEAHARDAYKLANSVRRRTNAKIVLAPARSLKSQMRYANKMDAQFAVILGSKETEQDKIVVKNLQEQDTAQIVLDDDPTAVVGALKNDKQQ